MTINKYLVTSALPYSNGRLHVGHIAGAYLPADIYVRYLRLRNREVRFVCGSDDHGVASLISAMNENRAVEELTEHYRAGQMLDFKRLGIIFDVFGGTHCPDYLDIHSKFSRHFFNVCFDKGFFEKRTSKQLFDQAADQFLPDRFVKGICYNCNYPEAYGDQCEACGITIDATQLKNPKSSITDTTPVVKETIHWYFRLSMLQRELREWLESKRVDSATVPWKESTLNFALGQLNSRLPDRPMTRDLDWGIPVPLDDPDAKGKVLYVWFEAPIGYVSFTAQLCEDLDGNWEYYEDWWKNTRCEIVHFVGEDNTIFHTITWPAMLLAEGSYQLPGRVNVNAFMNVNSESKGIAKIGKSLGTAIWIDDFLSSYEADPLRYYLTAIAPEQGRSTFDIEHFKQRNNDELLNTLGNFINRTLVFATKFFDGVIPHCAGDDEEIGKYYSEIVESRERFANLVESFSFKAALVELMLLARNGNRFFDQRQPWNKFNDNRRHCANTINTCVQTVLTLTILMSPILPFSAKKCMEMLGIDCAELSWNRFDAHLDGGHKLGNPVPLFAKL